MFEKSKNTANNMMNMFGEMENMGKPEEEKAPAGGMGGGMGGMFAGLDGPPKASPQKPGAGRGMGAPARGAPARGSPAGRGRGAGIRR